MIVRELVLPDTGTLGANSGSVVKTTAIGFKDGSKEIVPAANSGPEMNQADNISEAYKKEKSRKEKSKDEPEEPCHGQVESLLYAVDIFVHF